MSPPEGLLYTVLVFTEPGPKWYRATKTPLPRIQLAPIVERHWKQRRLVRIRPCKPAPAEGALVIPFRARADSPFGRQL